MIPLKAREAMELARRGDLPRAIETGEAAIGDAPDDGGLRLFLGMLHARQLNLHRALPHLRRAASLIPEHPLPRLELARALIGVGQAEDAEEILRVTPLHGGAAVEATRLGALARLRLGAPAEAARLYETALASEPDDPASLAQLGHCRLVMGDGAGAVAALSRAVALRPEEAAFRLKLADAQASAGLAEQGLAEARAAANALANPLILLSIARLLDLLGRPDEAEKALDRALEIDADCPAVLLARADLAERGNQLEAMAAVLDRAALVGVPASDTALLRARLLLRRGDARAALDAAQSAPEALDPGGRAQLIGQIQDRLGAADAAFAAFVTMNRLTAAEAADAAADAAAYRDLVATRTAIIDAAWYAGWTVDQPTADRPSPVFLVGFPRSGTTLLDTFLMGHDGACVLEERPFLHRVADRLGAFDRLPELDRAEMDELRAGYFADVLAERPEAASRRIVDKLPFAIIQTGLIHRLFPDARFVFVERHPCDVVLSCFMTRFDPRGGMANFLDLADTAHLYGLVMDHWRRCRAVFPLDVHNVRYERLVENAEAELRPLADFLGLDWRPELLDHQRTASERNHIATPSYAQVTEPLYQRARGRWQQYRAALAPVLPLLAPSAARMGYAF